MFDDLWRYTTTPFPELSWMREMLDDVFGDAGVADIRSAPRGTFPLVNVGATDEAVTVYVFAPGVDPKAVDVTVEGNVLTLKGRREPAVKSADGATPSYFRRERFSGEFHRAIALPEGLESDKAEAKVRNGVLEIRLPRRAELQPRRIEIQAA